MNKNDIELIKANIKGQLDGAPVAPICVSGKPGTAKSTTIELIAKELNMNIVTESAPTMTHEVLSGLPDTIEAPDFQENSIDGHSPHETIWSIAEMFARAIRAAKDKPTVLLIDDFHMVSPHLQAYFYGILLDRRLGNYKLSDNIAVVLTMNDSTEAGFNGINSAVRNRMAILEVKFDFDYWFENFGNRLHYLVSSFLKAKPQNCSEEETSAIEGYATARAWTAIAAELKYYSKEFIENNADRISGMQVSKDIAKEFKMHVAYIAKINFEETVKKRDLVDLSTKDPIDEIVYPYIAHFIKTVDDGIYLLDLMDKNINRSTFIGFLLGELYLQYSNKSEKPLSDGLTFVVDKIISNPMDLNSYQNTSKEKLEKAFKHNPKHAEEIIEKAAEYLI